MIISYQSDEKGPSRLELCAFDMLASPSNVKNSFFLPPPTKGLLTETSGSVAVLGAVSVVTLRSCDWVGEHSSAAAAPGV